MKYGIKHDVQQWPGGSANIILTALLTDIRVSADWPSFGVENCTDDYDKLKRLPKIKRCVRHETQAVMAQEKTVARVAAEHGIGAR